MEDEQHSEARWLKLKALNVSLGQMQPSTYASLGLICSLHIDITAQNME